MDEKTVSNASAAEVDRALREARAKWEQEASQREREIRAQAEQEARMTADERARLEHSRRTEALNEREKRLTGRELRMDALEELRRRELPEALCDALDYTDADCVKASLDKVDRAFREAVKGGIEARMRGEVPRGSAPAARELTDEEYYRGIMG